MAGAEIVLAAGIKREIGRQDVAIFVEEPDQAAEMIVVPVADDQRLDLLWIGASNSRLLSSAVGV